MSNLSSDRSTPSSASLRPWSEIPDWGTARLLAAAGLIITTLLFVGNTIWILWLTTEAFLGWRLRLLIPDACFAVPCALGCAVAAFSEVPWRRRAGWGLVAITLIVQMAVVWSWLPHE
jgi:hypothetical protein